VGHESDNAEEEAGHDELHNVVQRLATKMNGKDDVTVWRLTADIPRLRHSHRNVCTTLKNIAHSNANHCAPLRT